MDTMTKYRMLVVSAIATLALGAGWVMYDGSSGASRGVVGVNAPGALMLPPAPGRPMSPGTTRPVMPAPRFVPVAGGNGTTCKKVWRWVLKHVLPLVWKWVKVLVDKCISAIENS